MPTAERTTRFSGERLKALRREAGFSRTQLAAAVGRSQWALESWERDEFEPNLRSVFALIEVLGCNFEDLITNDDPHAGNGGPSKSRLNGTRNGKE